MAKFVENTQFDNYKLLMTDANSFTIGLTGLNVSVEISDDEGSFSSSIGSVSQLQSGWYNLNVVNSSEVAAGSFIIQAMASGANNWRDIIYPEDFSRTIIKDKIDIIEYAGGIWVDSGASNTNTVVGVDGIPSNPVSTLVAARTLADAIGVQRYYITNSSGLTLAATHESWKFIGLDRASILNLGSQDLDNSVFKGLSLAGTQGGTGIIKLVDCTLTSLLALRPRADRCCIAGDITILTGSMLIFDQCYSGVPGNATPELTFSAGVTGLNFRHYSGGLEVKAMTSDHTMSYETDGQLILNANCTGGAISARGNMSITDNSGNVTITKDAVYNTSQPADMTTTAMSSLNNLIFTDPLSKYEGSTDRNLARAVAMLVNKKDFSGDTLQVKKSDDSTNFWTTVTSGDSAAKPIVATDPT